MLLCVPDEERNDDVPVMDLFGDLIRFVVFVAKSARFWIWRSHPFFFMEK